MFESFSKLYAKLPPQQHSHSYHSLHSSGSRTALELTAVDSCEQQERCSITTSLVKQLTSSSAERLLLRVPIGRVPSCLRLSTVSPLSTSSTSLSCRLSWRFSVFPAHLPSPSLRTVFCWWQPSVLVVAAVVEWIDLSVLCVLCVVSRVSSFFRLFLLPPPKCGWSAVVVLAICCAIGHGCSECGSCFLTRDWLRHEAMSWSS